MFDNFPPFLVLGNPIAHSKSPFIHACFANQTGIDHRYDKALVPLDGFEAFISEYFSGIGKGANVTVPFKEQAYALVHRHTDRALAAGAVNTLIKTQEGKLLGDNTDGEGLLCDLTDKGWINKGTRVLMLGAGGAAKGALLPLLTSGACIDVLNRTHEKAVLMVERFKTSSFYTDELGTLEAVPFSSLENEIEPYDLIINATAMSMASDIVELPNHLYNENTAFYDMFYSKTDTAFLAYYRDLGCQKIADGLGMLVYQAALAFKAWHGVMPDAKKAFEEVKASL